jgi:HSP20 family protein
MSNVTRYNPLEDLFGELGKGFWVRPVGLPAETDLKMKLDVKEDERTYTVHAEIPGVKKEDIHVDVEGDHVTLRAEVKQEKEQKKDEKVIYSERRYGMVSRSFTLPVDVDAAAAKAEYKDGLLNLVLPKKAGSAAKRISVS